MAEIDVSEYLDLPYRVAMVSDQLSNGETVYVARHPELPGCMSHGESIKEAVASLRDARELYLRGLMKRGLPIPRPTPPRKVTPQLRWTTVTRSEPNYDSAFHRETTCLGEAHAEVVLHS